MSGLLTTAMKEAIVAGRVRQLWATGVPRLMGAALNFRTFHDDIDPTLQRVIDAGSRTNKAYNVSLGKPGDFEAGQYTIVVDNNDGAFSFAYNADLYYAQKLYWRFYSTYGSEMIYPPWSVLKHLVQVYASGSWVDLPCSPYFGRVVRVEFDDHATVPGTARAGTATIITEPIAAMYLRAEFDKDEYTVESDTGFNYTLA